MYLENKQVERELNILKLKHSPQRTSRLGQSNSLANQDHFMSSKHSEIATNLDRNGSPTMTMVKLKLNCLENKYKTSKKKMES